MNLNEKKKQKKVFCKGMDGFFFDDRPTFLIFPLFSLTHIFGLFSELLTEINKPIYRAIVFPHKLSLSRTRTHINDIYIYI